MGKTTVSDYVQTKVNLMDKNSEFSRYIISKLSNEVINSFGAIPGNRHLTLNELSGADQDFENRELSVEEWAVHATLTLYALHRRATQHSMNCVNISLGQAASHLFLINKGLGEVIHNRVRQCLLASDLKSFVRCAGGLIIHFQKNNVKLDYPMLSEHLVDFQRREIHDDVLSFWACHYHGFPATYDEMKGKFY